MPDKDYYSVLGVDRSADTKQIHQAYRRKARELHPDKNKDNPAAEDKFKELGEAYRILSDAKKRKQYDMFGSVGGDYAPPPGWGSAGFDSGGFNSRDPFRQSQGNRGWEDVFEDFLGKFGSQSRGRPSNQRSGAQRIRVEPERGSDIEAKLPLEIEDLFDYRPRQMSISVVRPCDKCAGSGRIGSGKCPQCAGSGRIKRRKTYKVKIPRGVVDGYVIRLKNQGNTAPGGLGEPGDLLVRIHLKPHPRYRITGSDLELDLSVLDYEAALGGEVEFEAPMGKLSIKLPAGAANEKKLKIKGKGLPKRENGFGDLIVNVKITVPAKPSKEQKTLYEKLRNLQK